MPIFVKCTRFVSGEAIMVNVTKLQTFHPLKESHGCALVFDDGHKMLVEESMEDIHSAIKAYLIEMLGM